MRNKVKGKVLSNLYAKQYRRIVMDFEEYMNSTLVMDELRDMDAKDVVRIVREIWEEVKSEN